MYNDAWQRGPAGLYIVCSVAVTQGGLPLGDSLAESWGGTEGKRVRGEVSTYPHGSQGLNRNL